MADNVVVSAGTGTTVAADEVVDGTLGTVKVQFMKIMDGTLDGTTKAAVGANGLAVDVKALPALVAGTAVIGALTANQSVNNAQVAGTATDVNSGLKSAGTLRVVIATDQPQLTAKLLVTPDSVALPANQSINVSQINAVTPLMGNGVTGTGSARVTIASDNTAFSVNTISPTLTKGVQSSVGNSVQNLKDAGRVIAGAATVIAGVTAVTTEALLSMVVTRDGVAAAGATTIAVTSGKRFRVQAIVVSGISTAAAVFSARISLRMNPSGAVAATSPILAIAALTQQAAALAQAGDSMVIPIADGLEFSGTMQFGLSQVAVAVTGTLWASIIGYEY